MPAEVGLGPGEIGRWLACTGDLAVPLWLSGGVAVDALVGRWTRSHHDVDLVALTPDREALTAGLAARGVTLADDAVWTTRWRRDGGSADLEIVFAVPAERHGGVLIVPGDAGRTARRLEFLPGYLDPHRWVEVAGVRHRVCSPEGEWWNRRRSGDLVPGRGVEPKVDHDLALLETLVPADRRGQLLSGSRAAARRSLDAAGGQPGLPVPLQEQERQDQRDDREQ